MSSAFLFQASHNRKFLDCIEETFPDRFYDWKITVMFYIAIHLLKEMASQYHADIGRTHDEISKRLDPERTKSPVLTIDAKAWRCYKHLYRYSKDHRYDGLIEEDHLIEARKKDYENCQNCLKIFSDFMASENIVIAA